jgi:hypothetical protein
LLLLHFSATVSRQSDQSETLAQRQALLDERLRRQEQAQAQATGESEVSGEPSDLARALTD